MDFFNHGYCNRCGNYGEGRQQWMFHQGLPAREFYCRRCLGYLRIYSIVGLTLIGLILAGFALVTLWLRSLG